MKILVAGDWYSDVHEDGVFQAYKKLGHQVFKFKWYRYFSAENKKNQTLGFILFFLKKLQNKFIYGPVITKINRDFIKKIESCNPDVISIYRGTHITKKTLQIIKFKYKDIILVCHNEDDPFTKGHSYWLWRCFLSSIPAYDIVLAHRFRNIKQYQNIGASNVKFLRSWFCEKRTYPIKLSLIDEKIFGCDVVFVGHYEDDGRVEYLEEIVKNGFKLKIFGPGKYWNSIISSSPVLRHQAPIHLVWGKQYNKALCGAKVALCFLSKLNQDTYTRRCFEIPATKTMLLSEFSFELSGLYRAGIEADFFKSKEELIRKLKMYVTNDALRISVAQAGFRRVTSDHHDVVSRMKQVIEWVNDVKKQNI